MAPLLLALLACVVLSATVAPLRAQGVSESRNFNAAVAEFDDKSYALAEKDLAEFVKTFPASPYLPEAILYQARAALKQQKYKTAVDLLSANAAAAGVMADDYRYWLGDTYLQSSNYQAAADAFASLLKDFPNAKNLLAASYGEALARFKLKDWASVVKLLQRPEGVFHKEAVLRPADELASRGPLLLAEALLEQRNYGAAEQVLAGMAEGDLILELKWRRQYLFCRIWLAEHRMAEALTNATNLITLAGASVERKFLAESVALQGNIFEQMGLLAEAAQCYQQNLAETVPAESARQALLRITALAFARNDVGEAARRLETFLTKHPDDAASDVALLTLGELRLRQHLALQETNRVAVATNALPAMTNFLADALAAFDRLITNSPRSSWVGRAQLDKGWSLWADGKIPLSLAAFQRASEELPHSDEQAVARFKLGEAEMMQKDYTNAVTNFRSVLDGYSDSPAVRESLFDQALYQIVRASIELGDLPAANAAAQKILDSYPQSYFGDRSMLLVGQYMANSRKPSDARQVFQELGRRFPDSPLTPQVELAIARTYVLENDWPAAINAYEIWLARYPTNESRADAEFHRASATLRYPPQETNALALFTNIVARFPTNDAAARAQVSIGFICYNHGDFVAAESNFQARVLLLNTNYSYFALMMAGRAAYARQGYADAEKYFQTLVNDNNCPAEFKSQAYFELGDTFVAKPRDPSEPLRKFDDAKTAFNKIPSLYPTSSLVPLAWGRIGDCYVQLASQDRKQYDNATNAYYAVLTNAPDASTSSQAEFKIGFVLESMARLAGSADTTAILNEAYRHYANVLYEKNLRDGEAPDEFWLLQAGLAAAELAKNRKQYDEARNIYRRLQTKLPSMRETLEKKIEAIRNDKDRNEKND